MEDAFLQFIYPEVKDLCHKFLTLITSVLVFTIAFSERIIDIKNSTKSDKIILVFAWLSLIISIILCGVGLVIHTQVAGEVIGVGEYKLYMNEKARQSYILIICSGVSFTIGLIFIILSAIKYLFGSFKYSKK